MGFNKINKYIYCESLEELEKTVHEEPNTLIQNKGDHYELINEDGIFLFYLRKGRVIFPGNDLDDKYKNTLEGVEESKEKAKGFEQYEVAFSKYGKIVKGAIKEHEHGKYIELYNKYKTKISINKKTGYLSLDEKGNYIYDIWYKFIYDENYLIKGFHYPYGEEEFINFPQKIIHGVKQVEHYNYNGDHRRYIGFEFYFIDKNKDNIKLSFNEDQIITDYEGNFIYIEEYEDEYDGNGKGKNKLGGFDSPFCGYDKKCNLIGSGFINRKGDFIYIKGKNGTYVNKPHISIEPEEGIVEYEEDKIFSFNQRTGHILTDTEGRKILINNDGTFTSYSKKKENLFTKGIYNEKDNKFYYIRNRDGNIIKGIDCISIKNGIYKINDTEYKFDIETKTEIIFEEKKYKHNNNNYRFKDGKWYIIVNKKKILITDKKIIFEIEASLLEDDGKDKIKKILN